MKTVAAFISIALAATALAAPSLSERQATSQVLLDKDAGFPNNPQNGRQKSIDVVSGVCQNMTPDYDNQVSAIAPNGNLVCTLHDSLNCQDAAPLTLAKGQRVNNLATLNFDNKLSSLNCTIVP